MSFLSWQSRLCMLVVQQVIIVYVVNSLLETYFKGSLHKKGHYILPGIEPIKTILLQDQRPISNPWNNLKVHAYAVPVYTQLMLTCLHILSFKGGHDVLVYEVYRLPFPYRCTHDQLNSNSGNQVINSFCVFHFRCFKIQERLISLIKDFLVLVAWLSDPCLPTSWGSFFLVLDYPRKWSSSFKQMCGEH